MKTVRKNGFVIITKNIITILNGFKYSKKGLMAIAVILSLYNSGNTGNSLFALEATEEKGYDIIPMAAYAYVSLDEQSIHTPGIALAVQNDTKTYIATYQYTSLNEDPLFGVPKLYHAINFLGDLHSGPWNTLLIFRSESDEPITGGLRTFQMGGAFGYDFLFSRKSSLIFGMGLAGGDFGVELSNGKPLLLIPIPMIRYKREATFYDLEFSFLTSPNLTLTIAPQRKLRLSGDVRIDRLRDAGDIIFESILWYRFFDDSHEYGDFAGVGIGIKREDATFDLANREDVFSLQYYGAFLTLDATVLKVSAGYAFGAVERHGEEFKTDLSNGFYVEIQGLYLF